MKKLFKTMKLTLLIASSLSIVTTTVIADDLPIRGPIEFSSYDVNNDGFVSEEEFNTVKENRLEQKLSAGMPMKNADKAPSFSTLDTNNDGKLSEIELLRGQNKQKQNNQEYKGIRL
jgi:Ca2+-binding EF-hand superfamily protein